MQLGEVVAEAEIDDLDIGDLLRLLVEDDHDVLWFEIAVYYLKGV